MRDVHLTWACTAAAHRRAAQSFLDTAKRWESMDEPEAARSCHEAALANTIAAESAEKRSKPLWKRVLGIA